MIGISMAKSKDAVTTHHSKLSSNTDMFWTYAFAAEIPSTGLTAACSVIDAMSRTIPRKTAAFLYKKALSPYIVVFIGGTGTGKSTLFNALIGITASETGVRRPQTRGPVIYCHKKTDIIAGYPFPESDIAILADEGNGHGSSREGVVTVITHERDEFAPFVFVDTPDLDSREKDHRVQAEDMILLADHVIFVTSQEKYADLIPTETLDRIIRRGTPLDVLFNKTDEHSTKSDIAEVIFPDGPWDEESIFLIPFYVSPTPEAIAAENEFTRFSRKLTGGNGPRSVTPSHHALGHEIIDDIDVLVAACIEDRQAVDEWLSRLERHARDASDRLKREMKYHFDRDIRGFIRGEIRRIYRRYDVFARPRRAVRRLIGLPLRLLGIKEKGPADANDIDIRDLYRKNDIAPVLASCTYFNRKVLEYLSPHDEKTALFHDLRSKTTVLSEKEIRERLDEEQRELVSWLSEIFTELMNGIPRHKEIGIYTTSFLWGLMVISLEVVIGGGLSFFDAALDSVVAPFITDGSVRLFASQEVRRVAAEMNDRYEKALHGIIELQKERYARCMAAHTIPDDFLDTLEKMRTTMEDLL